MSCDKLKLNSMIITYIVLSINCIYLLLSEFSDASRKPETLILVRTVLYIHTGNNTTTTLSRNPSTVSIVVI